MRWWSLLVPAFAATAPLALAVTATGCSSPSSGTFLQPDDLTPPDGTFDPNNLVSDAAFTDTSIATIDTIQGFLEKTSYNEPSFLSTYESNGVTAALAIVNSSQTYHLNPLLFLAHAQRAAGLIGLRTYPSNPLSVEYVFECGCTAPGVCDPILGGFDKQIDCLGRNLRASIDQITASGQTNGGWAIGTTTRTADNVLVTPGSGGTCALYQYLPVVGSATIGNELFFTIYQEYASTIGYFDPADLDSNDGDPGDGP